MNPKLYRFNRKHKQKAQVFVLMIFRSSFLNLWNLIRNRFSQLFLPNTKSMARLFQLVQLTKVTTFTKIKFTKPIRSLKNTETLTSLRKLRMLIDLKMRTKLFSMCRRIWKVRLKMDFHSEKRKVIFMLSKRYQREEQWTCQDFASLKKQKLKQSKQSTRTWITEIATGYQELGSNFETSWDSTGSTDSESGPAFFSDCYTETIWKS